MILLWFWLIPVWWGGTDLVLLNLDRQPAGSDLGAHPRPPLPRSAYARDRARAAPRLPHQDGARGYDRERVSGKNKTRCCANAQQRA